MSHADDYLYAYQDNDTEERRIDPALLITPEEARDFYKHVNGLNRLIRQIRKRVPEACYYLSCSLGAELHLMSGNHHSGSEASARQDRIIESAILAHADGGGW